MLRYLVFISLLAMGNLAFSQTSKSTTYYQLVGKVLDMNNNPIPYATVGLINHQIGTSTNQSGSFIVSLKLDSLIKSDTLLVSVLGYRSYRKPLNSIGDSLIIRLESHIYELDAVMITNLTAAEVVAMALKFKKKNYPTKKFKTTAFFRGLIRNDSTYVMMTEAVVNITDKGYHKLGDTKFYLQELKFFDERNFDSLDIYYNNFAEHNEVNILWGLDYMNYSFDKISYFPFKSIKYELDSITYFDNQLVYCISQKTGPLLYNRIFIRMDNFALIEVHRGWNLSKAKNKRTKGKSVDEGDNNDDLHLRMEVVQYKPYKGKWYLSYASLKANVIGGDKQKVKRLAFERAQKLGAKELDYSGIEFDGRILDPDKNNYFRHDELLITHIFDKKEKMKKGQLMDKKKYVYRYNVPYDQDFWQNYQQLLLNPNLKRAKSHLKKAEILNTNSN